jgi:ubiquinone/menaquinone biosynthesis C-methylase UbiE
MALLSMPRRLLKRFHPEGIPFPGTALYNFFSRSDIFQKHYDLLSGDIFRHCPDGAILDIGTGPGWLLLKLHGLNPAFKLTGIDVSASMVASARKNVETAGLSGAIRIDHGNANRLPMADGSFDAVVSTGSLHHWKEPIQCLNEVHRVLKEGGLGLIYDIVADTPPTVLRDAAERFGKMRMMLLWLHAFEEPFYRQENLTELACASNFAAGRCRFMGVLCCLHVTKAV